MSTFYVYSVEPMPRVDLHMKRDYNPLNDRIAYNGIYLPPIEAKTWTKIEDRFKSLRHHDRTDKAGHVYHVFADEIVKANQERLRPRGVVFLDHEPTSAECVELAQQALSLNMQFRLDTIQGYEEAMKEAEANGRTLKANTYVRECYELLNMEQPGSVAALRAQRQPGEAAAERFASAIEGAVERVLAKLLKPDTKPTSGAAAKAGA